MAVTLSIFLFGKPGQELNEGGEVTPQEVRALARELADRLEHTATTLEKLTGAGWEAEMALYDILLAHPYVRTESEARMRLDDLGIDPEEVAILEFEDEDEEFEDEDEQGPGEGV
jgi:hypothetical protein